MIEILSIDNALKMFEFFALFGKQEIMTRIGFFIQDNTLLILEHENFNLIRRHTLRYILSLHRLNAVEIQLFNACKRWAKAECVRKGIQDPAPADLRIALSVDLFLIRIPTMSAKHFLQGPVASGMFELQEQSELFNYIISDIKPKATSDFVSHFKLNERQWSFLNWVCFPGKFKFIPSRYSAIEETSTLQFKTSSDILLKGFCFSLASRSIVWASVELLEETTQIYYRKKMTYITNMNEEGIDGVNHWIEFHSPILISAGRTYKLSIRLKLDEIHDFYWIVGQELFTVKYDRKFSKESISIDFLNMTQFFAHINALFIH